MGGGAGGTPADQSGGRKRSSPRYSLPAFAGRPRRCSRCLVGFFCGALRGRLPVRLGRCALRCRSAAFPPPRNLFSRYARRCLPRLCRRIRFVEHFPRCYLVLPSCGGLGSFGNTFYRVLPSFFWRRLWWGEMISGQLGERNSV